ncbi:rRNA pseudouridine synthase [Telmatocola sphagniphila]|uniref:Pseudouridine synthase n=1 Tax=Telmatocola sphagniphila TaxID=1123043 RepID=A0A8E6B340_9BACT|nr:pseudouridine synthase [Telmatocola sphagniphila]QVL30972.1 rRNA pseudouridine synthase [Telmatocola sphagniphila]
MIRLNKFLAHAGAGSRRHCDGLIASGRVRVDGIITRELGTQIDPDKQKIAVDDKVVETERKVYWLVNKPAGYLCTNHDPAGRPRALDLIPHVAERVYTVGRLDEASEGLLLMTNDGDLAHKLMHPRVGIEKTYEALVAGNPSMADLEKLTAGIWLSDGKVKAKYVRKLKKQGDSTWVRIVLAEGKNREIRRMLAKLEHKVLELHRVAIAHIKVDRLPKGKCRRLKPDEIASLQDLAERKSRPRKSSSPEETEK